MVGWKVQMLPLFLAIPKSNVILTAKVFLTTIFVYPDAPKCYCILYLKLHKKMNLPDGIYPIVFVADGQLLKFHQLLGLLC